jgi:hypothetical protein
MVSRVILGHMLSKLPSFLFEKRKGYMRQSSMRSAQLVPMFYEGIQDKIFGYLLTQGFGLKTRKAEPHQFFSREGFVYLVPDFGREQ